MSRKWDNRQQYTCLNNWEELGIVWLNKKMTIVIHFFVFPCPKKNTTCFFYNVICWHMSMHHHSNSPFKSTSFFKLESVAVQFYSFTVYLTGLYIYRNTHELLIETTISSSSLSSMEERHELERPIQAGINILTHFLWIYWLPV